MDERIGDLNLTKWDWLKEWKWNRNGNCNGFAYTFKGIVDMVNIQKVMILVEVLYIGR